MSRIGVVNSETLLGTEVKEGLMRRPTLGRDIRLLSSSSDALGTVTEGPDGATLVQELTGEALSDLDVVIVCPDESRSVVGTDGELGGVKIPAGLSVIYLAASTPFPLGQPVVAGVNLEDLTPGTPIVSPHPSVIALAHFLKPFKTKGLADARCWCILPASLAGQQGLDELFDQTRAILSFNDDQPREVFGAQLAFNLLPASVSGSEIAQQLATVLAGDVEVAMQVLQGGVFHGAVVGASFRVDRTHTAEKLRAEIFDNPFVREPEESARAGPVAVAGQGGALLAELAVSPHDVVSLWGAIDNLTTGGAENALALVEALVAPSH